MRRWLAAGATGLVLATGGGPTAAAPGPPDAPQWYFDSWQVPSLWTGGARGQGITIAEIDTGVSGDVPELAARVLPGKDYGNGSLDGRTDHEVDAFGHGTAMASIMVARPGPFGISGLAPDAKVLPIAVPIRGTDDSSEAADQQVPQAIRWAVDHGGKIVSLSLGGRRDPARDAVPCPRDEQEAVTYAITKGALVVAASGNSGAAGSPVEEPGVCLGVVSVGAVDSSNSVAAFSSRHRYLTLSAPGVAIASLGRQPGDAYAADGTSQATALTSAAMALVWSKYPGLSARQVVARVLATLDRRSPTRDPGYGYGIVNPYRAITAKVPPTAANPVFEALDPFLAHQAAGAQIDLPVPKPAATGAPPGEIRIGDGPGGFTPSVMGGAGAAAIGALAAAVLVLTGLRSRRRRLSVVVAGPSSPGGDPPHGDPSGGYRADGDRAAVAAGSRLPPGQSGCTW